MDEAVTVPDITVRPDPNRPGQGVTDPLVRITKTVGTEVMDETFTRERARADMAAERYRTVGEYLDDPLIKATHQAISAVNEGAQAVSNAVQPALDQAGKTISKDVLPIVSDERFGMLGSGVTTGGALTGNPALAATGVAMLGMMNVGKGLMRQRFKRLFDTAEMDAIVEKSLQPSSLAQEFKTAIDGATKPVTDEERRALSDELLKSGAVTPETLHQFAPGTTFLSSAQADAVLGLMNAQSRTLIDVAAQARATGDPQLVDQATAMMYGLMNPGAKVEGAISESGRVFRILSNEDTKARQLIFERITHIPEGMSPLDALHYVFTDPATDPARQGKSLTQTFLNLKAQAAEITSKQNDAQAQVFLHEIEQSMAEDSQISLFPDEKAVKEAQKVYKQVTEQTVVEANKAAAEKANKDTFKLTPTGPYQPKAPQTNYIKEQDKAHLATIKEHQAQDLRMSEGTSVFSPKREVFKLTPPPGGARRPPKPKQLDLLNIIAKEPEPEQLALEMATSIEHPELSRQFLSWIKNAQKAIESGKTEDVGKVLEKIQKGLTPPQKTEAPPARVTKVEKDAVAAVLHGAKMRGLTPLQTVETLATDPSLTPDMMVQTINTLKRPTWRDGLQHIMINNMLTPLSDFVNFVASAIMMPMHLGARYMAGWSGKISEGAGGTAGVKFHEVDAMLHGAFAGFWDSVKLAGRVLKTDIPELGPKAVREKGLADNPFTPENMFHDQFSPTARKLAGVPRAPSYDSASYETLSRAGMVSHAINFFGVVTGLPGRLMLTGDQFVQSMAMQMEMHAMAYRGAVRDAMAQGKTETEAMLTYGPLLRDIRKDMPDHIREAGEKFGLEVTLNEELGKLGSSVMDLRETMNEYTGIGGTLVLPFFKTLANATKATWEFTPASILSQGSSALAGLTKIYRDDMFGNDPVKRDLARGKMAFGSMVAASLLWAAANGRLRGRGPDDPALREAQQQAEGLPDSFVFNTDTGESVQVSRLGVPGALAGMSADLAQAWPHLNEQQRVDGAIALTSAVVSNLGPEFMDQPLELLGAFANGVKTKQDLITILKSGNNIVPLGGTIRQMERALSPEGSRGRVMTDAREVIDKLLAKTPGYTVLATKFGLEPVPIDRNILGDPVWRPVSAYGTEFWNALYLSGPRKKKDGTPDTTIQRLSKVQKALDLPIGDPQRTIGKSGFPMSNAEYDQYRINSGLALRHVLEQSNLLNQLESNVLTDDAKRQLLLNTVSQARERGLMQLYQQAPDLIQDVVSERRMRATTLHTPKKATREPLTLNPE